MHTPPAVPEKPVGFLATVESPVHGIFGGYLLVDETGRPLEFHCTAPVRLSRAQQILYGPTLHGYLHAGQIGGTLLAEAGVEPRIVLVDQPELLQVCAHTALPVGLVRPGEPVEPQAADPAHRLELADRIGSLLPPIDLAEPFERIRAAIDEAQRHG
jgi:hypothetical protein